MAQLIDRSTIVAEIERRIILLENNSDGIISILASGMFVNEYKDLLSFLDTLEVKEVDLEKEIERFVKSEEFQKACGTIKVTNLLAKHFFELGLKAQKGE